MSVPKKKLPSSRIIGRLIARFMCFAITKLASPGIPPEERFAAYFLFRAVLRNRIFVYAPSITTQVKGKIPLIKVFDSFPDLINAARKLKPSADVLIFPKGGITYPIV